MLNEQIKSATKEGHQSLEKHVVYRLKSIQNDQDYAEVLKYFYSFFQSLEKEIEQHLPECLIPYFSKRRNANDIAKDIIALGQDTELLPTSYPPEINSPEQAIGALYVLEGSIMGGPYIVKMLQQRGIDKGFNFFNGYGDQSAEKWTDFTHIINTEVNNQTAIDAAIAAAQETFKKFENTFNQQPIQA